MLNTYWDLEVRCHTRAHGRQVSASAFKDKCVYISTNNKHELSIYLLPITGSHLHTPITSNLFQFPWRVLSRLSADGGDRVVTMLTLKSTEVNMCTVGIPVSDYK